MSGTAEMPTTPIEENKVEVREQTTAPESTETVETKESEQQNAEALQEVGKQALQFQTAVETNATQNEVLTQLLDVEERIKEAESKIIHLSNSIRPQDGEVHITPEQISEISKIDELLASVKVGMKPEDLRFLMMQSPTFLDDFIKNIEKDTKLEKKRKKQLKKAAKKLQKNLEAKHQNNYYFDQILAFSQLRSDLETGEYKTTHFAVLKHNPLFVNIYKNRKKLTQSDAIQLNIDGQAINVYNHANLRDSNQALRQFVDCNQPGNVLEKFITENTKMSLPQARNMIGTLGTFGIGYGIFMLGRWLFTEKDKDGNRKFNFSFGKIAALIGIPIALDYGSQMASGKGILSHLEKWRKTGEFPRNESVENATPVEKLALQQNTGQFALLGVPYATLQHCVKFKNGIATEIDASQLLDYYQGALESARARKDSIAEKQIGMQIESVKSMLTNEKAKIMLNNALLNLNIDERTLKDPANAQLTLNPKLSENNERFKAMELYLKNKGLRINPEKLSELNTKIFNSDKALEESDFDELLEEGFFMPNDKVYQELEKLSTLPKKEIMQIYKAFELLKKVPNYQNMQLELTADNKLKISSNGSSISIDPLKKTLDGLNNGGGPLPFETQEDLMRTALLINTLREKGNLRGESPDTQRETEKNWPFDVGNQVTKSIYFKKHGGEEINLISDLVPFLSEMDRKFPTIEADENRAFFVKYLNELWAKDHTNSPTSTASTQK